MKKKLEAILRHSLAADPYAGKKLLGDLEGNWSLHLNLKDRIVYSIDEAAKIVYIKRAKTHHGD
jgi:Txe/YoeB family toxin of Txe-Axe toxin-antitoxin module